MDRSTSTSVELSRRAAIRLGVASAASMSLASVVRRGTLAHGTPVPIGTPSPQDAAWQEQMDAYTASGAFPAVQEEADGVASSVTVEIPAIAITGEGQS